MNIPMKYEDVVAKLEESLRREVALREDLKMANNIKSGQRSSLDVCTIQINALQQRLTVTEQLLRDIIHSGEWNSSALEFTSCDGFDLLEKIDAALKPAEEGEGS